MFMYRGLVAAGAGVLVIATTALPCDAQLPTYGVGRTPTAEETKAWDVTIPSDGTGLPPGSGTAALGKALFTERCASCHGETGQDPKYGALVGGRGTLTTAKPVLTIGSFWPYAPTLWSYINVVGDCLVGGAEPLMDVTVQRKLEGGFDAVVMRCVGDPGDLLPVASRLVVRPGGVVVASGPPKPRPLPIGDWVTVDAGRGRPVGRFAVFRNS